MSKEVKKMNPEVKAKWVAALTDGSYPQTDGSLKDIHGFCCLGVASDLHQKEKQQADWMLSDNTHSFTYLGHHGDLPEEVSEWAGLPKYGAVVVNISDELRKQYNLQPMYPTLAYLNDHGVPFTEIAKLINEQL